MPHSRRSLLAGLGSALTATGAATGTPALAADSVQIPFRVTRGRPWIAGSINRRDPGAFLVNTGTSYFTITPKAAKAHGLPRIGQGRVQALVGRRETPVFLAEEVALGGGAVREYKALMAATLPDDDPLLSGGVPIARWAAMGLDFDSRQMMVATALHEDTEPDGYEALETLFLKNRRFGSTVNALPGRTFDPDALEIVDQRAVIPATFDGERINLLVDTGYAGMLFLFPDYVKARGLWDRYGRHLDAGITSFAGPARIRRVRGEKLKIGRYAFANPIVDLGDPADTDKDGTRQFDGAIGFELLRRLNFLHHPRRRRFYIRPSRAIQDVYRYDRAGLDAEEAGGAIRITRLDPAGAAARAGLAPADRITGWRGANGLDGLLWALQGAPGSKVEIQVERGGAPVLVTVVLDDPI